MALCPDHGAYTGDSCKKCQEPVHGSTKPPEKGGSVPKLDPEDKLTLVNLDRQLLKKVQEVRGIQDQLQLFINTMYQKYEVSGKGYTLDVDKMEFVARSM